MSAVTEASKVLDIIKSMSVVELSDLVKSIEKEFGVSVASSVAVANVANGQNTEASSTKEEQSSFSVILKSAGSSKIPVIKEVRAITSLGLKDAKDLVEAGDKAIKEGVSKSEAEEIKKKFESLGAVIELK